MAVRGKGIKKKEYGAQRICLSDLTSQSTLFSRPHAPDLTSPRPGYRVPTSPSLRPRPHVPVPLLVTASFY